MIRTVMLCGLSILVLQLSGCGGSAEQDFPQQFLNEVSKATGTVGSMRKTLDEKVRVAEEKKAKIKLDELKPVFEEAKKLREVGKNLIGLRAEFEVMRDTSTAEARKQMVENFTPKLQSALEELRKAEGQLDESVDRALVFLGPDSTEGKRLKEEIQNSRQEFISLSRRR